MTNDLIKDITSNLVPIGAGAGGALIGGAVGYVAGRKISSSSNRSSRRRKKNKKQNYRKKRKKNYSKKRRYPYTAGKRKDTSRRRIRFTKKGQPYIIQANGRAKFISSKSAGISRKRKGGKY